MQTMFKKKLGFLLGVMVLLSVAGYLICLLAGNKKQLNQDDRFLLVTSFYPMYVLAENLTDGMEGVEVSNLTENQTGCLHDYQLTSKDMKLLSGADVLLVNGAGMELFVEKILENTKNVTVIEASHGIPLLEGSSHDHDHEESGEEENGHEEHSHEENGHVWMDVNRYRRQAATVTKELQQQLPEQKEALEQAAAVYNEKLQKLTMQVEELKAETEGLPVVIFHEAFAYFADSLGMEVLATLSLDEETVPGAGEIATVIGEINYHGGAVLFVEPENARYAEKILAETEAVVVYLDPLTTGTGAPESYITGMQKNLDAVSGICK